MSSARPETAAGDRATICRAEPLTAQLGVGRGQQLFEGIDPVPGHGGNPGRREAADVHANSPLGTEASMWRRTTTILTSRNAGATE